MNKFMANEILRACRIDATADFYSLRSGVVSDLLDHANAHKYRLPKNANGSRARYFLAFVQKRC